MPSNADKKKTKDFPKRQEELDLIFNLTDSDIAVLG